jgi:alpha-tubulin suppressor-like RCC1 family protein
MALDTNGRVYVWGSNEHGQLGVGKRLDSMNKKENNFASKQIKGMSD